MPMTTPRTVKAERILFVRTVSKAIATTSANRPNRNATSLSPQRFDGIQPRRAHGGVDAEEQADERRNPDAERHRPDFHGRRDRRELRDRHRDGDAEDGPDDAAEHRQHDRFG